MSEATDKVRDDAVAELQGAMVPAPDDILSEVGPFAELWFVRQVTCELLVSYAMRLDPDDPDAEALEGTVGKALTAIGEATGILNAACIAMGLIDPDELTT